MSHSIIEKEGKKERAWTRREVVQKPVRKAGVATVGMIGPKVEVR